jgi:hypothetical protein
LKAGAASDCHEGKTKFFRPVFIFAQNVHMVRI